MRILERTTYHVTGENYAVSFVDIAGLTHAQIINRVIANIPEATGTEHDPEYDAQIVERDYSRSIITALTTAIDGWDAMTTTQKNAFILENFKMLLRVIRYVIKKL